LPRAALTLFARDVLLACPLAMRLMLIEPCRIKRVFGLGTTDASERRRRRIPFRLRLGIAHDLITRPHPALLAFGGVAIPPFCIQRLELLAAKTRKKPLLQAAKHQLIVSLTIARTVAQVATLPDYLLRLLR
jgi:hypothetical protein